MDEESLEEWARRREERRARARGKLRAVPLGPGRGAHVDPQSPRVIEEYDGTQWVAVGIVADLAAAKAVLYPLQPAPERPTEWDRPPLAPGRGRHRRTAPAEDGSAETS